MRTHADNGEEKEEEEEACLPYSALQLGALLNDVSMPKNGRAQLPTLTDSPVRTPASPRVLGAGQALADRRLGKSTSPGDQSCPTLTSPTAGRDMKLSIDLHGGLDSDHSIRLLADVLGGQPHSPDNPDAFTLAMTGAGSRRVSSPPCSGQSTPTSSVGGVGHG